MEIVTIIVNDWLIPLALTACAIFCLLKLVSSICSSLKTESENTLHIHITNDDMPDKIGNLFGNTFSNAFSSMFRR